MFSYGIAADALDEYVRIGESTAMESLKWFATSVVQVFGEQYLRFPTKDDIDRQLTINTKRGMPGTW